MKMKDITVISNDRDCFIELIHRDSDSGSWIVRRYTKFMWFKKRVSSHWFNDSEQAATFAHQTKKDHDRHQSSREGKEILQHAKQ